MRRDISDQVSEYRGLVESLARRLVGRNDAEFDDLVQEGLIIVWQSLERGIAPSAAVIEGRMTDWVRLLGTQVGRGRGKSGEAVEYLVLLPLERFDGHDTLTEDSIPLPGHDPLA